MANKLFYAHALEGWFVGLQLNLTTPNNILNNGHKARQLFKI